ncbi:MAG: Na(+)/H(+) antiporter subunit C [Ancrocorticia sp.]
MSSLALIVLCGALVAVGVYLVLERSLSRIILGLAALGNGINILFLIAGGRSGEPPIVGSAEPADMADPLAQAMVLTAIVITLAMTGFLLAMAYRTWQLRDNDEVRDDREDRAVAKRKAAAAIAALEDDADLSETAKEFHDDVDTAHARTDVTDSRTDLAVVVEVAATSNTATSNAGTSNTATSNTATRNGGKE